MTARGRSYVLLAVTLLVGIVIGALGVGAVGQLRAGRIEGMRQEDRFVREMERIIRPHDAEQWARVRPLVEEASARNKETMRRFDHEMRAALDALIEKLATELDGEQLGRLQRFAERPPGGPAPPGRRPPPGTKR